MPKKELLDYNSLFSEVYTPQYTQKDQDLLRASGFSASLTVEELQKKIENQTKGLDELIGDYHSGEISRPLTEKEAERVSQSVQEMRASAQRISDKIKAAEDEIDQTCNFIYKFKKKSRLKKAVKILTGKNVSKITYKDYKAALDLKRKLEMSDAGSFFIDEE